MIFKRFLTKKSKAFSLITAIFMLVILSTIALLVLNISAKTVQETTAQFRHEQSKLLAQSYTELAILSVMGHDRASGTCIKYIKADINTLTIGQKNPGSNIKNIGYKVKVTIQYIANNFPKHSSCVMLNTHNTSSPMGPHMLIDTYVSYRNPDNPTQDIGYFRRTLQKL